MIKIAINGFLLLEVVKVVYGMEQLDVFLLKIALNSKELSIHALNTQPKMDHAQEVELIYRHV